MFILEEIRFEKGILISREIKQDMKMPDWVLMSLFLSSNGSWNMAHTPEQIFQHSSIFGTTEIELLYAKAAENKWASLLQNQKMTVHPAKTQISMGIHRVWSESSLCAQWVAKDPRFLLADSEASDQTGRMPRLIWVFAGHSLILFFFSWGGSNLLIIKDKFAFRNR